MKTKLAGLVLIMFTGLFSHAQYWEELATLSNPPNLAQMVSANGKIYVVSGSNGQSPQVEEYDPVSNNWTSKAAIPKGCYWASAVAVGKKIYVMGGGHPYPGQKYNYIYDTETDTWTTGADLLDGRMYHSATTANGKVYLMGGQNGDGTTEWYFDEYDTATNIWTRKANLPNNGAWYCGATSEGNYVYRIAGGGSTLALTRDYFDRYNITTNTWDVMLAFRTKIHAPKAVNYKGKLILIGGYSMGNYIDSIYEYNPATEKWRLMDLKLKEPRSYHSAAVIDDCIYVYGGHDNALKGTLIRHCDPYLNVKEKSMEEFEIKAFPNPVEEQLNILITSPENQVVSVEIMTIFGQKLFAENMDMGQGENEIDIDMSSNATGSYLVKIRTEEGVICKKIIKK
jgi:N-acetylneuraminic acid mutarotase